jgi:GTP pyrophosphokinase
MWVYEVNKMTDQAIDEMFSELLEKISPCIKDKKKIALIEKAYLFARDLHKGQKRQSGEPYIIHPLSVAFILSETPLKCDEDAIAAAILHDVIEDCGIVRDEIFLKFNEDVADLVDGVSKISDAHLPKEEVNTINTRKIIMSIIRDIRILYIKLADRLHNMRTLQFKSEFKQKENALETLNIFAPLANYIGAYQIKCELEDLSLKFYQPDSFYFISDKLQKFEHINMPLISELQEDIYTLINMEANISYQTKNIYDIFKRLEKCNNIEDIPNLLALKVIVKNIKDCYKTLERINSNYPSLESRSKDYIKNPKTNLYRSLHTSFVGPNDLIIQAQIRTPEMDEFTKYGIASYMEKYNSKKKMQDVLKNLQFYKTLSELSKTPTAPEFIKSVKNDLFTTNIYVYTTNGDVIELPYGSTPIDFAYHIYHKIGNQMIEAYVNDERVNFDYILKNRDRVNIVINKKEADPFSQYAGFVKTNYAKRKINGS